MRCIILASTLLAGCGQREDVALGTLEWDRIAMPSPAAEKIVRIYVREGQRVEAGQQLLALDPSETLAQLRAAEAAAARQQAALVELRAGPRQEEIERARASLAAARAEQEDSEADYRRLLALGKKDYVSKSDIDRARATAESAAAQVREAQEQLLELERGTRVEEIEQGEAALAEARAQAQARRVLLDKLSLRAPRGGVVDSLPFKLGDEAPVGAALVVLLSGETPYARVYVPQSMRLGVTVGQRARVILDESAVRRNGKATPSEDEKSISYPGRVRMVRNEPSFTPYFALTGDDAARLSYIAEIQLRRGQRAAELPAGLPLRVEFSTETVGPEDYPDQTTGEVAPLSGGDAAPQQSPRQHDTGGAPPEHEPYDGEK